MEKVIGIDLGTTNSCVAVFENGRPVVIPGKGGYKTTPSVVAIAEGGKRLVGRIAKRQAVTNAENTVFAAKRLIGRSFDSPEVKRALATCPFKVVEGKKGDVRVRLASRDYSVPEISSYVLMEMKKIAEDYLGTTVSQAVITVPAYFNDSQRQATKDAGRIAGLEVLRIINEPTAAALAYGFERKVDKRLAVFDLGGGTFDISVLEISDGVFEVLSTAGDTFLGGENFDERIIHWIADQFQQAHSIDLRRDAMALQRLKEEAEKAKIDLSEQTRREIHLPFIASDGRNALHLRLELNRAKLEELVTNLVDRSLRICNHALADAGLTIDDIEDVVLVGGQTRMPLIQRKVQEFFKRPPCKGVHPDEVVALGAAIQAAALVDDKTEMLLIDVSPISLGIATTGGGCTRLIPRNTKVPTKKTHMFTTVNDNQTAVKIVVLQGESEISRENQLLGEFMLTGIRKAPKGLPEIEVTFSIDSDGIVNVSARDLSTGVAQSVTMSYGGGLEETELSRLVDEQKDLAVREQEGGKMAEAVQRAESLILETSKVLHKVAAELGEAGTRNVRRSLRETRQAIEASDYDRVVKGVAELERSLGRLLDMGVS